MIRVLARYHLHGRAGYSLVHSDALALHPFRREDIVIVVPAPRAIEALALPREIEDTETEVKSLRG
jgi:hypothetical protein